MLAKEFYSTDELMELLNLSRQTITRFCKSGELPAIYFGRRAKRFTREAVEQLIQARTKNTTIPKPRKKKSLPAEAISAPPTPPAPLDRYREIEEYWTRLKHTVRSGWDESAIRGFLERLSPDLIKAKMDESAAKAQGNDFKYLLAILEDLRKQKTLF